MKKLFVRAYFQSNLGDDLFVLQLVRRYPQVKFYLYALGENRNAFLKESNVVLPGFWDRLRRKLTHSFRLSRKEVFDGQGLDGTVAIGGSIFWEGAELGDLDASTVLIGPNCEDRYSPAYQAKLEQALAGVYSCCFRDRHSYRMFRQIPGVEVAPDVLYDWEPEVEKTEGRGIAISLVPSKGVFQDARRRESYYDTCAAFCDLCGVRDIPVKLLGFCGPEGDGEAIAAVKARVKNPERLETLLYNGNVEEMTGALNSCETILATRFHAMILGWVLGKNVVPIIYSSKQTHVLEDSGFRGPMWNALAGEELSGEELLNRANAKKGRLDIAALKQESKKQFAGLDSFLNL